VNRLNPTSPKDVGVFYSPPLPGECDMRGSGGGCHSWSCVLSTGSGDAACGSARLDAVDQKEIMQPLDIVRVELCLDAFCVESCF
jgi:hypothetical protein